MPGYEASADSTAGAVNALPTLFGSGSFTVITRCDCAAAMSAGSSTSPPDQRDRQFGNVQVTAGGQLLRRDSGDVTEPETTHLPQRQVGLLFDLQSGEHQGELVAEATR